jgi:hypothetical protein
LIKMKIPLTLIVIALTGLITGIAFAAPLIISEFNVKPWIQHIQGSTADFDIEVIFANFTILRPNKSTSEVDNLSLNYQVWVRVTNPSDLGATLLNVNFAAAEKITAYSGAALIGTNSSGGWGWEAEGVLVDGKWYNLTWVNGTYPYFDRDGNMVPSPFEVPWQTGYWMEGVQLYQRHVNGTVVATYLNMNGTWTDVTDNVVVEEPEQGGYSMKNVIADQMRIFQESQDNFFTHDSDENDTEVSATVNFVLGTVYVQTGEGCFNNYWKPGESRIILLEGIREIESLWENSDPVEVLNSGSVTFKTTTFNVADTDFGMLNNTVEDTWSYANELKTVTLTRDNESYIFNMDLLKTYEFDIDEWKAEVFLEPR